MIQISTQSDESDIRRSWNLYYSLICLRKEKSISKVKWSTIFVCMVLEFEANICGRFTWTAKVRKQERERRENESEHKTSTSNNAHFCFYNKRFIANFHCSLRFSSIFHSHKNEITKPHRIWTTWIMKLVINVEVRVHSMCHLIENVFFLLWFLQFYFHK